MFRRYKNHWRIKVGNVAYICFYNRNAWPKRGAFIRGFVGRWHFDKTLTKGAV